MKKTILIFLFISFISTHCFTQNTNNRTILYGDYILDSSLFNKKNILLLKNPLQSNKFKIIIYKGKYNSITNSRKDTLQFINNNTATITKKPLVIEFDTLSFNDHETGEDLTKFIEKTNIKTGLDLDLNKIKFINEIDSKTNETKKHIVFFFKNGSTAKYNIIEENGQITLHNPKIPKKYYFNKDSIDINIFYTDSITLSKTKLNSGSAKIELFSNNVFRVHTNKAEYDTTINTNTGEIKYKLSQQNKIIYGKYTTWEIVKPDISKIYIEKKGFDFYFNNGDIISYTIRENNNKIKLLNEANTIYKTLYFKENFEDSSIFNNDTIVILKENLNPKNPRIELYANNIFHCFYNNAKSNYTLPKNIYYENKLVKVSNTITGKYNMEIDTLSNNITKLKNIDLLFDNGDLINYNVTDNSNELILIKKLSQDKEISEKTKLNSNIYKTYFFNINHIDSTIFNADSIYLLKSEKNSETARIELYDNRNFTCFTNKFTLDTITIVNNNTGEIIKKAVKKQEKIIGKYRTHMWADGFNNVDDSTNTLKNNNLNLYYKNGTSFRYNLIEKNNQVILIKN